jgi:hypothetical protein
VVTPERLEARRAEIAASPDLRALLAHLTERATPLVARLPPLPEHKALLSTDGGVCPEDGARLAFDPWSAAAHRCPACGQVRRGERHDRHWAKFQHLWLAERAAHLAGVAAFAEHEAAAAAAAARAREILAAYAARYWRYPNQDNVLGPSRLFFSTYLESLWILSYLAAATLLRAAGLLDDATARGVTQVADEAANLIGEYDEGFSNRQTWNDAALAAIAVWFDDRELLERAAEGPTGLLAHLVHGFRTDGMWYEGENYHLFALRGLLTGLGWCRAAGLDVVTDPALADRLAAALTAPALTALPDLTFPARKDSRFGVSLAQPMYLECWEVGGAWFGKREAGSGKRELEDWLAALYAEPAPAHELFESYLHDASVAPGSPSASRFPLPASRTSLSWWALLEMAPALAGDASAWKAESVLLEDQGLAVLRAGDRYASLEGGPRGGGHGHADRLHLTLHAGGVPWLPDFGTGSYVARDLFWYRSTLAHNAPRLDGVSQVLPDASCETFDVQGDWAWTRARWGDVTRTIVAGPHYLIDVVELASRVAHVLEVPWHFVGAGDVVTPGRWTAGELPDEFVTRVEQFVPAIDGPVTLKLTTDDRRLTTFFALTGDLLRAEGPGKPGGGRREAFYVARARGAGVRMVTLLAPDGDGPRVEALRVTGDLIEVDTAGRTERHHLEGDAWWIEAAGGEIRLGGRRPAAPAKQPFLEIEPEPSPASGAALRVDAPPALDGTLDGFDPSEPLVLDTEDQYRRSEEPWSGPEDFAARAYAAWDDDALYLAVEVTKPDLCFRAGDAPALRLDNEADDIHSDGIQVYVSGDGGRGTGDGEREVAGWLVVPEPGGRDLRVRAVEGTLADPSAVRGAWRRTDDGYRVTLALAWPAGVRPHVGGRIGFDLIVNEMLPGRERRAGQLVWSGGGGWVWLRGDRQDPGRFGVLELLA